MLSFAAALCCCREDSDDERSDIELGPLLNRPPSSAPTMPPPKVTYGKKTSVAGKTIAALAAPREPLADITTAIGQLQLAPPPPPSNASSSAYPSSGETEQDPTDLPVDTIPPPDEALRSVVEQTLAPEIEEDNQSIESDVSITLRGLCNAYAKDRDSEKLEILSWEEVMPEDCTITKIAEASYAEVYRVATTRGDSIIKIMRIKHDFDEEGHYPGHWADEMIPEFRIMNALTEVPGFVSFKDAYIIKGKATAAVIDACQQYSSTHSPEDCTHPPPSTYTDQSFFLAMELGDAGTVLEDIVFTDINQVWDILIAVVLALARAEDRFAFEHRDLHENNICYTIKKPSAKIVAMPRQHKFGRSGIEITLIDYGLSRAELKSGEIISYDLEGDLTLFHGTASSSNPTIQFETYRRMRTWLLTKRRTHESISKMIPQASTLNEHTRKSWNEYIPYTNVLWIRYLIDWFKRKIVTDGLSQDQIDNFAYEIEEFEKKLEPKRTTKGFNNACSALNFIVDKSWVSPQQVRNDGIEDEDESEDESMESQDPTTSVEPNND